MLLWLLLQVLQKGLSSLSGIYGENILFWSYLIAFSMSLWKLAPLIKKCLVRSYVNKKSQLYSMFRPAVQ